MKENNFCIYVDTLTHLRTAEIILKKRKIRKYLFLSTSDQIERKIPPDKFIKIDSIFSLFRVVYFKNNLKNCNILLASRVDSIFFQILFFLKKFEHFYTFDEGLFTIQENSRYNLKILNPILFDRFFYWSNKVFSFPKNPSYFYKTTSKHFTYFDKSNFRHSMIDDSRIELIPTKRNLNKMKNILIGQPWQLMFLNSIDLKALKDAIKNLNIDLYVSHPREDLSIFADYLDTSITQIKCISPAEDFFESIADFGPFNIFVVASTLTLSVFETNNINIIEFTKPDEALIKSQETLKEALTSKNVKFNIIKI